MLRGLAVVAVVVAWAPICPTLAAEPNDPLALEECIEIALQNNHLLLASGQWREAALARVEQARAFPQPLLGYDSDLQERLSDVGNPGETYLGVSKTFELPGRRSLRVKVATEEAMAGLHQMRAVQLNVVFEVKGAFYGRLLSEQKLRSVEQNLELSKRFLQMSEIGFEAGDQARVEVVRAQVEEAGAERELRAARNETDQARAKLNILLGREPGSSLRVSGALRQQLGQLPDEGVLLVRALSSRSEIASLETALRREALVEEQARRAPYPDVDIGIARHRVVREGSWWDITVSVPIPLFTREFSGRRAEARANQAALRHELSHAQRDVALEIGETRRAAEAARQQILLYEEKLLAGAEEVYEMFAFSYQTGEIGGIELIAARRGLLEVRMAYADALFAHAVSLAALERAVGQGQEGVVP